MKRSSKNTVKISTIYQGGNMSDSIIKSIPSIDLSLFTKGSTKQKEEFYTQLRYAAHEIGFFYLVGHDVSDELCHTLQLSSCKFFALPLALKQKIALDRSPHFRGYTQMGGEYTLGSKDYREEIDLGFEQSALVSDPAFMRLYGPNQWDDSIPELAQLRVVFYEYQRAVNTMGMSLLEGFSHALYGRGGVFTHLFDPLPYQHVKIIHYPGLMKDNAKYCADTQGVGAHKDDGFLTLLLVDDIGGLQVEVRKNEWLDVGRKKGAFIVNIGEFLELATDGYLRATTHRVKSPKLGEDRYSIAMFLGADLNSQVRVIHLPDELKNKARGIECDPSNPLIAHIGWNYLKHRLRSHPDVAQKYYADVYDASNPANPVKL